MVCALIWPPAAAAAEPKAGPASAPSAMSPIAEPLRPPSTVVSPSKACAVASLTSDILERPLTEQTFGPTISEQVVDGCPVTRTTTRFNAQGKPVEIRFVILEPNLLPKAYVQWSEYTQRNRYDKRGRLVERSFDVGPEGKGDGKPEAVESWVYEGELLTKRQVRGRFQSGYGLAVFGDYTIDFVRKYDRAGRVRVEEEYIQYTGQERVPSHRRVYSYDTKGRKMAIESVDESDYKERKSYTYNDKGQVVEERRFPLSKGSSPGPYFARHVYGDHGAVIRSEFGVVGSDALSRRIEQRWGRDQNDKLHLVERRSFSGMGQLYERQVWHRDQFGNLLVEEHGLCGIIADTPIGPGPCAGELREAVRYAHTTSSDASQP